MNYTLNKLWYTDKCTGKGLVYIAVAFKDKQNNNNGSKLSKLVVLTMNCLHRHLLNIMKLC